jgi:hypothetical protein
VRGVVDPQQVVCPKCGVTYGIGGYPFCRGGHGRAYPAVIDDQLEGGPRRFETMGDDEPYIESKSQWRREMAARGLVQMDRFDSDHHRRKFRQHDEMLRDTGQK